MSTLVSNLPLLLNVVNETYFIAATAGSIVRKILHSGNLDIIDKGKNDLQTKADRASQNYIISSLTSKFPKAIIIGEEEGNNEGYEEFLSQETENNLAKINLFSTLNLNEIPEKVSTISEDQLVIWIDPLDGTSEFTRGLVTHVTILVGMAFKGEPVGGVIHQPFFESNGLIGRTIWGVPEIPGGFGGMDFKKPPTNKKIITTTASHRNDRVDKLIAALKPDEVLRVGGAGHKVLLLLEGQANAYVFDSAGCKKWDTCAPEAVLKAAGGELTTIKGEYYQYHKDVEHLNSDGLLATAPGESHSSWTKSIKEALT